MSDRFLARNSASLRVVVVATVLASVAALAGCELVANLQRRSLGFGPDGGGEAGVASAEFSACTLGSSGKAALRLGNLVASPAHIDFCLRPTATASFAGIKPLFAGAGGACAGGLEYKAVTTALPIDPGNYEVKVVAAGTATCDGDGIASINQVLVSEKPATAVYVLGNGRDAPIARRYAESAGAENIASTFRTIVSTPDFGNVNIGFILSDTQPLAVGHTFLTNLAFGEANPGSVTSGSNSTTDGYVNWSSAGGKWRVAATTTDTGAVIADTTRQLDGAASYTFFLVGRNDGRDFPLELIGCDETKSSGILANCSDTRPLDFVADVMNVDMGGAFVPAEPMRRPAVAAAISGLTSDAVCVLEAYSDADKEAIIAAAKGSFPYSYYEKTTWDTPPTNPHTLSGGDPLPITGPACTGSETKMNAAIDCLRDNCTDNPGSDDATLRPYSSSCMSSTCAGPLSALILGGKAPSGTPSEAGCWGCVFAQILSYEKMGDVRTTCVQNAKAEHAFRGQNSSLILSRHPIKAPEAFVVPGGPWRSVALRAPMTLDNGANLDFYCASATTVVSDCIFFPITSRWASPTAADCQASGREEQRLGFTQVRDFVDSRSTATSTRAILAGSLYAGPSYQDVIAAEESDNFSVFSSSLALGVPPDFTPLCTNCGDNPIRTKTGETPNLPSYWSSYHLLKNIPVTAVRHSEVILTEANVTSSPGDGAQSDQIPISRHYGFRSVVRIAP